MGLLVFCGYNTLYTTGEKDREREIGSYFIIITRSVTFKSPVYVWYVGMYLHLSPVSSKGDLFKGFREIFVRIWK